MDFRYVRVVGESPERGTIRSGRTLSEKYSDEYAYSDLWDCIRNRVFLDPLTLSVTRDKYKDLNECMDSRSGEVDLMGFIITFSCNGVRVKSSSTSAPVTLVDEYGSPYKSRSWSDKRLWNYILHNISVESQ